MLSWWEKIWAFCSISQRARALQSIKYILKLPKWGKKALQSEHNCTHQANYPEALLVNEISQEARPAWINQRTKPAHLQQKGTRSLTKEEFVHVWKYDSTLFSVILVFSFKTKFPWVNVPKGAAMDYKSHSSVTLDKNTQLVIQSLH